MLVSIKIGRKALASIHEGLLANIIVKLGTHCPYPRPWTWVSKNDIRVHRRHFGHPYGQRRGVVCTELKVHDQSIKDYCQERDKCSLLAENQVDLVCSAV